MIQYIIKMYKVKLRRLDWSCRLEYFQNYYSNLKQSSILK